VWAEEVERLRLGGKARTSAIVARAEIERPGARIAMRACEPEGRDGTRLAGCAKVYVPLGAEPSEAPYGVRVRDPADRAGGGLVLRLLAYGERHPQRGRSVYERAHWRVHGRYPDQE
jgi:hypothetical protein